MILVLGHHASCYHLSILHKNLAFVYKENAAKKVTNYECQKYNKKENSEKVVNDEVTLGMLDQNYQNNNTAHRTCSKNIGKNDKG